MPDQAAPAVDGRSGTIYRRRRPFGQRALITDLLALGLAVAIVEVVSPTTSPTGQVPATPLLWLLTFCALTLLLFQARRMYVAPLRLELTEVARLVLAATALAAVLTMGVVSCSPTRPTSRRRPCASGL